MHSNDFSVNESILTGESLAVFKDSTRRINSIADTSVLVDWLLRSQVIGNETKLGKIGTSLENIKEEKTPLELQIANFVKKMAIIGIIVFVIVWAINFIHSKTLLKVCSSTNAWP